MASLNITPNQETLPLKLLEHYLPCTEVWAYGSRLKGRASSTSDLDLVVFTTLDQKARVSVPRDALAESNLPFPIDLHIWDELPERFHTIIRGGYMVLQAQRFPQP